MTTLLHLPARLDAPIACGMTGAPDTPEQRMGEYRELFASALLRRERRPGAVVFALRADARAGAEDLARREAACCPFLDYRVEAGGDEVVWTASDPERRPAAEAILDAFHELGEVAVR